MQDFPCRSHSYNMRFVMFTMVGAKTCWTTAGAHNSSAGNFLASFSPCRSARRKSNVATPPFDYMHVDGAASQCLILKNDEAAYQSLERRATLVSEAERQYWNQDAYDLAACSMRGDLD